MKISIYRLLTIIIITTTFASSANARGFKYKVGDILFKEYARDSSFCDAVTEATTSAEGHHFSHVGIVTETKNNRIIVTEAVFSGVKENPIDSFITNKTQTNEKLIVVVGRLKKKFRKSIPQALKFIKQLVGKEYDKEFLPDNDKYYCSELISDAFLYNDIRIFPRKPMSFKNKDTGETSKLWIEYFNDLQRPIPEGVEGTNPGDMSKSDAIELIKTIRR